MVKTTGLSNKDKYFNEYSTEDYACIRELKIIICELRYYALTGGLKPVVDQKQKRCRLGRSLICIEVDLESRSFKRAALIAYVANVIMKQRLGNS